jgi:hypothetical protein
MVFKILPTRPEDILAFFWWWQVEFKKQTLTEVHDIERMRYTDRVTSISVPSIMMGTEGFDEKRFPSSSNPAH